MANLFDAVLAAVAGPVTSPKLVGHPCPSHPNRTISLVEREHTATSGLRVRVSVPVCPGDGKPHGFKLEWVEKFLSDLEILKVPGQYELRLAERGVTTVKVPADAPISVPTTIPRGLVEMRAVRAHELVLTKETSAGLDRVRRRIVNARKIFTKRGLDQFTALRQTTIFFGPPGTGKTSAFVDVTEGHVSRRYLGSLRDLVGAHLGDTEKAMRELTNFVVAHRGEAHPPAILLDDGDDFLSARSNDSSAAGQTLNGMKVALLSLLDQAGNVPILITTNRVRSLDGAIHRRIVEHVEFPLPDQETRAKLLGRMLGQTKLDGAWPREVLAELAGEADGLSPAELEHAVVQGVLDLDGGWMTDPVAAVREGIATRRRMGARINASVGAMPDHDAPDHDGGPTSWPGMR